jgi:hypothetical protein
MRDNDRIITEPECNAITARLDGRIDSMGARVTAIEQSVDRRFKDMGEWIKDVAGNQKWSMRLLITTAIGAVGSLIGVIMLGRLGKG